MRCRKVRSSLSTYFRQELPADRAAEVHKHLEECSSCRREAEMVKSVQKLVRAVPTITASDGFNTALLELISREGLPQKKTRAHLPGRIPRFGRVRLATVATMAVVVLAFGLSLNLTEVFNGTFSPPMAITESDRNLDEDRYLTVQPTNNPLLNERKSVSRMVQQYNRWREYSRSLRSGSADQFIGNAGGTVLASSREISGANVRIRPVVKSYLIVPQNQPAAAGRNTY